MFSSSLVLTCSMRLSSPSPHERCANAGSRTRFIGQDQDASARRPVAHFPKAASVWAVFCSYAVHWGQEAAEDQGVAM